MNKKTQNFFTKLINKSILILKKHGFSTNNISDKWHTFGDLYYHRMMLTQALSIPLMDMAWKSKLHEDGSMFDNSFIIGFSSEEYGDYTYHYNLKYWDLFHVRELPNAPKYDGHKSGDIDRLVSMANDRFRININPKEYKQWNSKFVADFSPVNTSMVLTANFEMTDELKDIIYGG